MALPAVGQAQGGGRVPALPSGVPAVLLPVQSATPLPSGAWPGGAESRRAVVEQLNAELQFAFDALGPAADDWTTPGEVVEMAGRNPTLNVEPRRLAGSLLGGVSKGDRIPSPLHGQLRRISALFDSRYLMLPLRVGWEAVPDSARAGSDSVATDSAGGAAAGDRGDGRAVLDLALVDIRRGVLLWRGAVHGEPGSPDSPEILATLAARLAEGAVP